ncbi:hypothetical protein L6164_007768 [Bauhinia variegata]|uniref:Uncharacterized protein n=1 Tax=Bauhinia variegata TaxID=167791 RepID=A0ACB9PED5_BAUVA|nr:hypothetical protein L6164_007768 [Bauhinia variegata]
MSGVTSSIAAKFEFFPPSPPSYTVIAGEARGSQLSIPEIPGKDNVDVLKRRTRSGSKIIAVYVTTRPMVLCCIHRGTLLICYDYSGYGRSTGKPTECNTYADIEGAYNSLKEQYGLKDEQLILYGQSVGSGPTLDLASHLSELREYLITGLVTCPVLVIHGTTDQIVGLSHGKQLWELCKVKYEPLWVSGDGHSNLELYPEFIKHLKKFVQTIGKSKEAANGTKKNTVETENQCNASKESESVASDAS